MEAELYAGTMAAQECRWLCRLLEELGHPQTCPTLWCDNMSTIALTQDPVFHGRTKHIEVRYFFLRQLVQAGELRVVHVATAENPADIFTKSLDKKSHHYHLAKLGLAPV